MVEVVWRFEQKNILNRFIEGQTHFSNACGAKISLTLNEPIYNGDKVKTYH